MQGPSKLWILLLGLAFAVGAARLALKTNPPQPSYAGKPVSYWLTDGFSYSSSMNGRPPAEAAFRCMGSNAVPFLIATLAESDGVLRQIYFRCSAQLPVKLRNRLPHPVSADVVRSRAILALALIGPAAKPAIPSLIKVLAKDQDSLRRANAISSLDSISGGHLPNEVVDALLKARSDRNPMVARRASEVLQYRFPLGVFRLEEPGNTLVREDADVNEMKR